MQYYCTYFDRNYLVKALALFHSLERHEEHDFTVIAVCLDEITRIILDNLKLPYVVLIPLHLIEKYDTALLGAKSNRDLVEYYWTLTPAVVLYLLETRPEINRITYLDADLFFYSSPAPIFEELGADSVLVHEHRFSESLLNLESFNGRFNVGLISFKNDDVGVATLKWWREQCIEWCYLKFENGKMGDQLYLDEWPRRFDKVHILQHLGAGVAPWNHAQYAIKADVDGDITVNGFPLIFYHFHALEFTEPDIIIPAKHIHYPLTAEVLRYCYIPYLYALNDSAAEIKQVQQMFDFGLMGVSPNIKQTFISKRDKCGRYGDISSTHVRVVLDKVWDCFCTEQFKLRDVDSDNLPMLWPLGKPVTTCDDLLLELEGRKISREIKVLYFIGAHLFQESEIVFRIFPNIEKIYLFEAIVPMCKKLNELFDSDSRIEIFSYAISDKDEQSFFHVTDNSWESSSLLPLGKHLELFPHVHELGVIPVECRTVESVMVHQHLRHPDMLFIDVQGAEYRIISSLTSSLKENIKMIYTEASHEELYVGARPLDDIIELLKDNYHFSGFAPLFNHTPTHGNALFVNNNMLSEVSRVEL